MSWWIRRREFEALRRDVSSIYNEWSMDRQRLLRDIERLEADLREVRSTQNGMLTARQNEGQGLAALLMEQAEPEETEEQKRLREEQKLFMSFLNKYQGDGDHDG